jgi:glycosyltransferase involved in cell wall biosynthesis
VPTIRSPAKLLVLRRDYKHWGLYTGVHQVFRHFDRSRWHIEVRRVSDAHGSRLGRWLTRWLRATDAGGWYDFNDLLAECRAALTCLATPPDVLQFMDGEHGPRLLAAVRPIIGTRRPKLVAVFHQPPALLAELISPNALTALDAVVLTSDSQLSYFERLAPPGRVHLILHGVDTDVFAPTRRPSRDRAPLRVITVGRWLRDWPTLTETINRVPRNVVREFVVVGEGDHGLCESATVRVRPRVTDDELVRLYQDADALLLPLMGAAASNTLLEALACGLPVISTAFPAVHEYVGEAGILVGACDVNAILVALTLLQQNPVLRQGLGAAARRRAEQLDWRRVAHSWQKLYEDLIEQNGT